MATKSSWRGAIQFGGFPIYVAAFQRLRSRSADSFKNLCPCHGQPIVAPKTCATTGEVLDSTTLLKGIEVRRGDVRQVPLDAVEALKSSERTDMMEMRGLPPVASVQRYMSLSTGHYALVPDEKVPGSDQPVQILWNGLIASERALVSEVIMRAGSKPTLIGIVATVDGLDMHSLPFAGDVLEVAGFTPKQDERAAAMFEQFAGMQGISLDDYSPDAFPDTYSEGRAKLMEAALAGEPIPVTAQAPALAAVPDLMAAMAAALDDAKPTKKPAARKAKTKAAA